MKQLVHQLGSGVMSIWEIHAPHVQVGWMSVRTHFSIISPGTEGHTVQAAGKNLIGKARERPDQVRRVLDRLMMHGPLQTFRAVQERLDAILPAGIQPVVRGHRKAKGWRGQAQDQGNGQPVPVYLFPCLVGEMLLVERDFKSGGDFRK